MFTYCRSTRGGLVSVSCVECCNDSERCCLSAECLFPVCVCVCACVRACCGVWCVCVCVCDSVAGVCVCVCVCVCHVCARARARVCVRAYRVCVCARACACARARQCARQQLDIQIKKKKFSKTPPEMSPGKSFVKHVDACLTALVSGHMSRGGPFSRSVTP